VRPRRRIPLPLLGFVASPTVLVTLVATASLLNHSQICGSLPTASSVSVTGGPQQTALGTAGTPGQPGFTVTGAVSTFGPPGEVAGATATGVSDTLPGISLHVPGTHYSDPINVALDNHWFRVTTQGHTSILKDIDLGPADYLNRAIDITGAGVTQLGIPYGRYQTGAPGTAVEVAGPGPQSTLPTTGNVTNCSPTPSPGGYVNPYAHTQALYPSRIDMGVDQGGTGQIDAFGNARITFAATGIGGGWTCATSVNGGVVYQLLDGPYAGKYIYVFEDVIPAVHVGQVVQAGQKIADFPPHGCDEMGWAVPPGTTDQPLAETLPGFSGDQSPQALAAGDSMSRLLKSVNGPPGLREGAGVGVQAAAMPAGYP
jgi:hypothetical protein